MSLYKTIPPVPLCDSCPEMVFECRKIIEWADNNLPLVAHATKLANQNEMTENERLAIIAAYMIHAYVKEVNISYAFFEKQPLFVRLP